MGSVNKWIGIGNLGGDPELKRLDNGKVVCNFSVACNEKWKDANGQMQERTEWVRVTTWGATAENCGKYLKKGQQAYVEGRLQTRSWEKDGQKHFATDVVADRVVFLGSKPAGGAAPAGAPAGSDEDIPF
jgi:single-strand DNA-binding protein